MSDSNTTPIVISVISLAGTIIATLVGAYITLYSDERKAQREVDKILAKYRDPLLLAAQDLQARVYGICAKDLLDFMHMDEEGEDTFKDALCIYTAYVVGQYFSWCWILRRQAQFMALASTSPPKWSIWGKKSHDTASALNKAMDNIRDAFNTQAYNPTERPFMLFKAHQLAIGEIMSCQDQGSSEYYCMGYATFVSRWKNGEEQNSEQAGERDETNTGDSMAGVAKIPDRAFRRHFRSIEKGIEHMYAQRKAWRAEHPGEPDSNQSSDGRLRRLQHLSFDLADVLDPAGLMSHKSESLRVPGLPGCRCSRSPCHEVPKPVRRTLTSRSLSGLQKVMSFGAEREIEGTEKKV